MLSPVLQSNGAVARFIASRVTSTQCSSSYLDGSAHVAPHAGFPRKRLHLTSDRTINQILNNTHMFVLSFRESSFVDRQTHFFWACRPQLASQHVYCVSCSDKCLRKVHMAWNVVGVSCGSTHTVVLTNGGSVFTFGNGRNHQLGHRIMSHVLGC